MQLPVFAGLRMIFDAVEKVQEVQQNIFQILAEISNIITSIKAYIKIHRTLENIQQQIKELYVSMIEIFTPVMGWLFNSRESKFTVAG